MIQTLHRIPVTIVTGFLGAGKSTLLNRILKDPAVKDVAVIINEFGDVGIDHLLVESSDDSVIELSDGCLCCTVRGELVETLAKLVDRVQTGRTKAIARVVIETTGLADPAPVMQSVMGNPAIATNYELDGVVTLVDAVNGLSTLDHHEEARRQAAVADRILISKRSLAAPLVLAALEARLRALNPRALLMDAEDATSGTGDVLINGLYNPGTKIADVDRWLRDEGDHAHDHDHDHDHEHGHGHHHHHHHDDDHEHDHHHQDGHDHHAHQHAHDRNRHDQSIRSFSIIEDRPIDPAAIDMFIDLLRSAHGEKLLRMKAIIATTDRPDRPLVLHGVQSIFHPPQRLAAWPDPSDRRTRMVIITRDLPENFVRGLFDALTGKPQIDRPDRAALSDNPLAVPGMRF